MKRRVWQKDALNVNIAQKEVWSNLIMGKRQYVKLKYKLDESLLKETKDKQRFEYVQTRKAFLMTWLYQLAHNVVSTSI